MSKPRHLTTRTYGHMHRNTNAHQAIRDRRASAGIIFDAAHNAGERGTYTFAERPGATLDEVRPQRPA